jgi:hypothetical protein
MNSPVDTRKGSVNLGQGTLDMVATLKLIAVVSVLEECVFAGTLMEVATMHFDNGGKIAAPTAA